MKMTSRYAIALVMLAGAPLAAAAQDTNARTITCAQFIAMNPEEQMKIANLLVAESSNALELNDLATGTAGGPLVDACSANMELMAFDVMMAMKK